MRHDEAIAEYKKILKAKRTISRSLNRLRFYKSKRWNVCDVTENEKTQLGNVIKCVSDSKSAIDTVMTSFIGRRVVNDIECSS